MKIVFIFLSCFSLWMQPNGYNVGDAVTDFKLKNVDGKMVALADYKDAKGMIVIFDSNTCPYSKAYNSRIRALHDSFAKQGFPLIVINSNASDGNSFDDNVKAAQEHHYTFAYLKDETQEVARRFGATNTPHVFILTKNAAEYKIAYIGAIDDNARNEKKVSVRYVEDAVNALLRQQQVAVTKTKAIGCGIAWK